MLYQKIISIEHLFQSWNEFKKNKRGRRDVQIFERNLEDNLFELHTNLANKTYQHKNYTAFNIYDPKFRHIHKATVLDRIVHHGVVSIIEPIFDKTFIYDSYSCRLEKGTHGAVKRLVNFANTVSKNYTEDCWALKLDIKKFFASVNHKVLLNLLKRKIRDHDILWLLIQVIDSFPLGIPLGNLTSQVFANIYLNELDQFVKHRLRIKCYLRYADDFIMLSCSNDLNHWINGIEVFLWKELKLTLHPKKITLRRLYWGIDFLGYIVLPHHVLPRTKTKRRMFKKLNAENLHSYLGYLSHANSYQIEQELKNSLVFLVE